MKKIIVFATTLFFLAGLQAFSQGDKPANSTKAPAGTAVKQEPKVVTTHQPTTPPPPGVQKPRPKLSKEDSLKRQHKIDSIRKVMAERRAKEGTPKISKEDSLKRAHKIDSLRKAAKQKREAEMKKAPEKAPEKK
ncbi:MAG: hypothetical protein NTU44_14235 [Bacteroidetes bacterium]|nr:hypothetical protein [Bacteroidota bacterium]